MPFSCIARELNSELDEEKRKGGGLGEYSVERGAREKKATKVRVGIKITGD